MKKLSLLSFAWVTLLLSCNEEQYIEGFVPEYREVAVQQAVAIKPNNYTTDVPVNLTDFNFSSIRVQTSRYKYFGGTSGGLANGDSVILVSLQLNGPQYVGRNTTQFSWMKFTDGEEIALDESSGGQSAAYMLAAAIGKAHTTPVTKTCRNTPAATFTSA